MVLTQAGKIGPPKGKAGKAGKMGKGVKDGKGGKKGPMKAAKYLL